MREVAWEQLELKRDLIEETLGKKLSWEELPTRRASRIGLYLDQPASVDRKEEWATYRFFLLENLGDFRDALQPHVDALGTSSGDV